MAIGTPEGWGFMGAQGYYQGQQANQNAMQSAMQNQAYGGMLGGAGMQQMMTNPYAQIAASTNSADVAAYTFGHITPPEAPAKKTRVKAKRLIERLRAEIEEWHGDVLQRWVPA